MRNVTNDRSDTITRVRRGAPNFDTFSQQFQKQLASGLSTPPPTTCSVTVDGVQVPNAFADPVLCSNVPSTAVEYASGRGLRPDESGTIGSQVGKLMNYGGLVSLSFQTSYTPKQSPFVSVSAADVALIDRTNAYTSTISLGFATPLPFGKNFGHYGTQQASDLKLAQARLMRSGLEHDLVTNNTLLAVDNAYWDLVASLKVLQIAQEQKEILQQLYKRAQSYFKLGEMNEYSMNQVEARLSSMRGREALAWNGMISASETLSNLLNGDLVEFLLPVGYQEPLERIPGIDPESALSSAMERNVDIKRSEALLEESQIELSHRINQAKPDLTLGASLSLGQSDQFFGYPNLGRSLANIFNPDIRTASIGLTFRLPLGNVAAKAALGQARVGVMQARDQLTQSRNQAVQQLSASMDALQSGLKQTELSRINMNLAQDAYDAASRRRAMNLVTEFELLEIQNDLLNARLNHIDALVQYRKSAARILAAQNMLAASVSQ
jgi:outer membrane protein TolC